ncbi:MAG TPA: flagellar assembly protein FliH [Burkholderiaceae bacterium]|nr:flagellar assembly protein FliH [Burkholderiaceae bacterium]
MSNGVIPKEQMSAFQRWEMASFNERPPSPPAAPKVEYPTIEELAEIRDAARRKGHDEGWADGRAAGLAQGQAEAAAELQHLRQIAETFGHEVARADEVVAQQMLDLALDLAKAMLKTALAVRPQLVLPIVAEAIHYLPALQQPALLFLHPEDARLITNHMSDELEKAGWRVVDDAQLERGGCRIETASNQIDASTATRWQRIAAALGKDSEWLDA